MKESTSIAPGGASSMTLPVDAFAFELMHGVHLCNRLLGEALLSATDVLKDRYPELTKAIVVAEDAVEDLYQAAGRAWDAEAKRAEGAYDPAVTAALERAVDAVRAGFTGGAYSKTDSALDAAALRVRALLEPPCTQTE